MTLAQIVTVLNWAVGFGIPILVALVTRSEASVRVKALFNIGLNLLATAIIAVVADLVGSRPIHWFDIVFAFVTSFIISGVSYLHIWKPTGIAPFLSTKGVGRHAYASAA